MEHPTKTRHRITATAAATLPVRTQEKIARDQFKLNAAEMGDPRLSRIYLSDMCEVPDSVKNYPKSCQAAYLVTFNRWVAKSGDVAKAMRAGMKAVRNKSAQLAHKAKLAHNRNAGLATSDSARELKEFTLNKMTRDARVQLVVP